MASASPSPADWALLYAQAGWRSFPVIEGGKAPKFKGWQKSATTDPALIAQYWRGKAGAERNLGLVCGESFDRRRHRDRPRRQWLSWFGRQRVRRDA